VLCAAHSAIACDIASEADMNGSGKRSAEWMCFEIQHVPSGKRAQICLYAASLCEGSKQPICMSQDLRLFVKTAAVIKTRKEEAKSLVGKLQLVV
jgi:hypothetical protein